MSIFRRRFDSPILDVSFFSLLRSRRWYIHGFCIFHLHFHRDSWTAKSGIRKKNIYCLIDQRCYVNPWLDFGHKRTKTLSPCLRWVFTGDMEFFGRPELGKLPFCRECSVTLCTADPIKAGNTARRIPLIALLPLSQRSSWHSVTYLEAPYREEILPLK